MADVSEMDSLEFIDFDDDEDLFDENLFVSDSDICVSFIDEDDVPEVLVHSDVCLDQIPQVVFVDDSQITFLLSDEDEGPPTDTTEQHAASRAPSICSTCGKSYARLQFFEKHVKICHKRTSPCNDYVSESDFAKYATGMFQATMEDATSDKFMKMAEPGKSVALLAESISGKLKSNHSALSSVALFFSTQLFPLINRDTSKTTVRESIMEQLHHLAFDKELELQWKTFVGGLQLDLTYSPLLLQYVLPRLLQQSLRYRNKCLEGSLSLPDDSDLKLTDGEQETLRYVSGYILYSLRKVAYASMRPIVRDAVLKVLDQFGMKGEETNSSMNFLDFTRHWVNQVNRGGLYHVSDEFFIFIRRVENVARSVLNTTLLVSYAGEDIRDVLLKKFHASELIDMGWMDLTRELNNEHLGSKLKNQILQKWVNIRANAFIKAWIQIARRKEAAAKDAAKHVSEKGEVSMRKSLSDIDPGLASAGQPSLRKTLSKKKQNTKAVND